MFFLKKIASKIAEMAAQNLTFLRLGVWSGGFGGGLVLFHPGMKQNEIIS